MFFICLFVVRILLFRSSGWGIAICGFSFLQLIVYRPLCNGLEDINEITNVNMSFFLFFFLLIYIYFPLFESPVSYLLKEYELNG
jgi:hypothetical protein